MSMLWKYIQILFKDKNTHIHILLLCVWFDYVTCKWGKERIHENKSFMLHKNSVYFSYVN